MNIYQELATDLFGEARTPYERHLRSWRLATRLAADRDKGLTAAQRANDWRRSLDTAVVSGALHEAAHAVVQMTKGGVAPTLVLERDGSGRCEPDQRLPERDFAAVLLAGAAGATALGSVQDNARDDIARADRILGRGSRSWSETADGVCAIVNRNAAPSSPSAASLCGIGSSPASKSAPSRRRTG